MIGQMWRPHGESPQNPPFVRNIYLKGFGVGV
jgi:hypothetical protein